MKRKSGADRDLSLLERFARIRKEADGYFKKCSGLVVQPNPYFSPRDNPWSGLPKALKSRCNRISENLAAFAHLLGAPVRQSPLLTEADEKAVGHAIKGMRAAIRFESFEHWDTDVLHDEGTVLGVRRAGEAERNIPHPDEAKTVFTKWAESLERRLELITPGSSAPSSPSPHTAIPPMFHELEPHTKRILSDILVATESVREGLDALKYRADHFDQSDILDQLQGVGYLRRENDKYWVSLTALPQLEDDKAKHLLKYSDKIFAEIKTYYRENQRDQIKLTDLAKRVGLDLADVKECLSYMVEGSWWGGRTTDFFSAEDSFIKPSEAILRYQNFHNVINQLREWQHYRIQDRDHFYGMRSSTSPSQEASSPLSAFFEQKPRREKPFWFPKLPSEFRALLAEVYDALLHDMRALSSMGLRTVIDMACNDRVGDTGGLAKKLTALEKNGYINSNEKAILEIAVDVGNASAHRGHNPTTEDLNTLLDIVEHLLQGIYVLPDAAERLKQKTPSRKRRD